MKKYTIEEIAAHLADCQSLEADSTAENSMYYNLNLDADGELMKSLDNAAVTIYSQSFNVHDYTGVDEDEWEARDLGLDPVYNKESLDDPDFRAIVEDMYSQYLTWYADNI